MAWDKTKPENDMLLINFPPACRANWDAVELGTDPNLQITNAKVSPGAGIEEADHILVVLIFDHEAGAEDHEVEQGHGHGSVEVRLLKDHEQSALNLGEPERGWGGLGRVDIPDAQPEPLSGGVRRPAHHACGAFVGRNGGSGI